MFKIISDTTYQVFIHRDRHTIGHSDEQINEPIYVKKTASLKFNFNKKCESTFRVSTHQHFFISDMSSNAFISLAANPNLL